MTGAHQSFFRHRAAMLPFAVTAERLLARDAPGGLREPGTVSPNGHCRLIPARDGWLAVNLARPEDVDLIPAFTEREGPPWAALGEMAGETSAARFVQRAEEFQLPMARLGEAEPAELATGRVPACGPVRVLDTSSLWAGPLCAGLLACAGASVMRIESAHRPDPTAHASPQLDQWLNGAKRRISLDLTSPRGRERLSEEVSRADVLVTSARPAALARIGIDAELTRSKPGLIWAAITAHGWDVDRVGFGDDCAAAGGLVRWDAGQPCFAGDALADPLTGLEGALEVLARLALGQSGRTDIAMASIAAAYARALGT